MFNNIYGKYNHLLRRWSIDIKGNIADGLEFNAIDMRLHSIEVINSVKAYNTRLETLKTDINEYLWALQLEEPTNEPLIILDNEGEEIPNPIWENYNNALEIIENVSEEVLSLIGENEELKLNTINSIRDEAPQFEVVLDGPALYPLTPAQFWGMVYATPGLEGAINTAFSQLSNPMEAAVAKARFEKAEAYHRDNPLFDILAPIVGLSKEEIDQMWMIAKDL